MLNNSTTSVSTRCDVIYDIFIKVTSDTWWLICSCDRPSGVIDWVNDKDRTQYDKSLIMISFVVNRSVKYKMSYIDFVRRVKLEDL